MRTLLRSWRTTRAFLVGLLLIAVAIPAASAMPIGRKTMAPAKTGKQGPQPSGVYDMRDANASVDGNAVNLQSLGMNPAAASALNTNITECPQAGRKTPPTPLDQRVKDSVERVSDRGDDIRVNQDFSCFPQDETSIDVNPKVPNNIVVGANDYRLGTASSGFYATTDGGKNWYDGIIPFPSAPAAVSRGEGFVISGGDPVIAFDRAGVVYYSTIAFFRGDDTNGIFVSRSTNGGFTWSRGCVPAGATDATAACGGPGDVRQPGDGRVTYVGDNDNAANRSVPFNDKEWLTSGPRPAGVNPVCFTPITRAPAACDPAVVGIDRLYVTWTRFTVTDAKIYLSYSDDQGRSWAPEKAISGSAPFCAFGVGTNCDSNQFSVPTVNPTTGHLYVAFENFNTFDEDQYLVVRSTDGGNTFAGPFFVTPVFDVNFPLAGVTRPDCTARGQQGGRIVYTNSCFRSNASGNIVVDKRGGAFADDLYLVISDNRNGTQASSNADIFLFKSTDGGSNWIGPTRVNNDTSNLTVPRTCVPADAGCLGNFGNDQWWPWVDIGEQGQLNVVFFDRRLDTNSVAHEWPTSRERPGNYLVWRWGAQCKVNQANSTECLAPGAALIPQPAGPIDPGADPVPGQGPAYLGTLNNIQISDIPSNFDYTFRAGLFAGDYENVVVQGNTAYTTWTDARNGRSSRNQPGRNPLCEQSDVFLDIYPASNAISDNLPVPLDPFLVTECAGARP